VKHEIRFLKQPAEVAADGQWFRLFPMGEVRIKGEKEPARFDAESAQLILEAFRSAGHDMVIDYEHATLGENPAPAAGWIPEISARPDGLYVRAQWTENAKRMIAAREYRYFSPVMAMRKADRKIVGLHNVALTNQPRMNDLPALAAKETPTEENPMLEKLIAFLGLAEDATVEDLMAAIADMLKKMIALLALPEDATKEDLVAAIEEMVKENSGAEGGDKPVAAKEVLDALGLSKDADVEAVVAKIKAHQTDGRVVKPMAEELTALRSEIADMKANGLIQEALKDGKISPDEAKKWGRELARTNPKQFGLIVLSRPRGHVVPVDGLDIKGGDGPGKDGGEDEAVAIVAKQMGVSMEDIKKYGATAE
jgi:phage I-like protein